MLKTNKWRRPIYFALTVSQINKIGLDPYLRMDGLVFKLMPEKATSIDPQIVENNLLNKYQYRGINDRKIFMTRDEGNLMRNYQGAFLQLLTYYQKNNDNCKESGQTTRE